MTAEEALKLKRGDKVVSRSKLGRKLGTGEVRGVGRIVVILWPNKCVDVFLPDEMTPIEKVMT